MEERFFFESERLGLRALKEEDAQGNYGSWLNNREITSFNTHGRYPVTEDSLKVYINSSNTSRTMMVFAIVYKETNEHIGNISLQNIDWIDSNAEIAFLLGEKKYWGKGIMLEAGNLLIKHAFNSLNLHRVYCGTSSFNVGMQKLAVKLGMSQEGIRRDALFKNGQYLDIIEFGIVNT
jgi:RimJ/RimL family protein N-acetyltransferase